MYETKQKSELFIFYHILLILIIKCLNKYNKYSNKIGYICNLYLVDIFINHFHPKMIR